MLPKLSFFMSNGTKLLLVESALTTVENIGAVPLLLNFLIEIVSFIPPETVLLPPQ